MKDLAPNTPVIVGIGFHQEKSEDPATTSEAYQLMVQAVRRAADDAGSLALLGAIESIAVPQGMWEYRNPGRLIANALGCPSARSILAGLGVLQLQLLSDLCRAIAAGKQHVGVVTGGEAKFRQLRGTVTDQPAVDTREPEGTPRPDEHHTSVDPWCSDLESRRGLTSPVEFFAIVESAWRHQQGLDVDAHRDQIAALYSHFSEIAATNPHAWRREPTPSETIRDASPRNAMLAFPYTKLHSSQWNVNQAVAILVCSAARARELGLDDARWIYPRSGAQSKHVVPLAQQRRLYSHPGTVLSGERALALAGVSAADVTAAELYSCFPGAIQSFAHDLKLDPKVEWTVTGTMTFAGGPFNSASLEGAARMVEVLRDDAGQQPPGRRIGLVSNMSGIFSKQACALFSNEPNAEGYRFEDVTAAVAACDIPVPLADEYTGPATIIGYTVVCQHGVPSHAIAFCDTPAGERTVVRSSEPTILDVMMREELCGRVIEVASDGGFALRQ